jgi:hypothetical protein
MRKIGKGTNKIVKIMLELTTQIQKLIRNMALTINKKSMLFSFRS